MKFTNWFNTKFGDKFSVEELLACIAMLAVLLLLLFFPWGN